MAGKTFGVPTANVVLTGEIDLGFGTYAGYATWGEKMYEAMIYYGANDPKKLEVHCFEFSGNLYGTRLTVDPRAKIGEDVPWTTEEAMKEKIVVEIDRAKAWFAGQRRLA